MSDATKGGVTPFYDVDPRSPGRFVFLPAPYERTTSYVKGCAAGPEAFRDASAQIELYEPDVDIEPSSHGFFTSPPIRFGEDREKDELDKISHAADIFVEEGKFLVTIGGEHTITVPLVNLFVKRYPSLSVLQIDAHPDLRETYDGSPYSHACVGKRIVERAPLVQVGVRSWCADQQLTMNEMSHTKIKNSLALKVFPAERIAGRDGWQREVINSLTDDVYLTFDLDGLDPSVVPAVGTPEPGGLGWYETLELMRALAKNRRVVGMDVVELKPIEGDVRGQVAAARLVHRILAYIAKYQKSP